MAVLARVARSTLSALRLLKARLLRGRRFTCARLVLEKERCFDASPEKVFALLCPTREYDWIQDWRCDLIYSTSGFAEQDCIFVRPEIGETWIVTRYDPGRFLFEVAIFVMNRVVVRADVALTDLGDGRTKSTWRYTCTALDRVGNWLLTRKQAPKVLERRLNKLLGQLDHYLATGTKLVER